MTVTLRTNHCPNPSFEAGIASWSAVGSNETLGRTDALSTLAGKVGSWVGQVEAAVGHTATTLSARTAQIAVTPGEWIGVSVWIGCEASPAAVPPYQSRTAIRFGTSGEGQTTTNGLLFPGDVTLGRVATLVAQVPVGKTEIAVSVIMESAQAGVAIPAGKRVWFDQVLIVRSSSQELAEQAIAPYFDGSTSPRDGRTYAFVGTEHASASIEEISELAGGYASPFPGAVFVEAPRPFVHPPTDPGWSPNLLWLEGWDGSRWSLSDDSSGLVLRRGVRGLGRLSHEDHRDEHAGLAGSRWRDSRATDREVFLPVQIFHDGGSLPWKEHNRAFSKILRRGKTAWLHIVHPDGTHRKLGVRYQKGADESFLLDPTMYGWATYGLYFVAEDPYWQDAQPIDRTWASSEPIFWFGGGTVEAAGPPWGISDHREVGTATISNPGDVEQWPEWTYRGPADGVTVGIGSDVVEVPIALTEGQHIVIDTRPHSQTAIRENGTDVTDQLGSFDFAPIPEGEDVELAVTIEGAGGGSVSVRLVPLYEWGIS